MALYNFLYKDEALIASLYAQIFQGRLLQINHSESDTNSRDSELGIDVKIISANANTSDTSVTQRHEVVDPHDAATIDVLNHLQKSSKQCKDASPKDVVFISGGMFIAPYEFRKTLIEYAFDANNNLYDKALAENIKDKKHRTAMISLAKKSCIGSEDEVRFFIQDATSSQWYWGSLQQKLIISTLLTLQMAYGSGLIPVNMVALCLSIGDVEDESDNSSFARPLHYMTSSTNKTLAGEAELQGALAPLVIMQQINTEELSPTE